MNNERIKGFVISFFIASWCILFLFTSFLPRYFGLPGLPLAYWMYRTYFFLWGWLPTLVCVGVARKKYFSLKSMNKNLKLYLAIILATELVIGVLWMLGAIALFLLFLVM